MKTQRATLTAVREQAQRALETLSIEDIRQALQALPTRADLLSESRMAMVFERAEKARFKDDVLGSTILPAHLYVIDAILEDRGTSGPLLDCLIRAVRNMVYRPAAAS